MSKHEPVYQAIWAENTDFDEVLISPVMFQDHMPDKVLSCLNKVSTLFYFGILFLMLCLTLSTELGKKNFKLFYSIFALSSLVYEC